eukprot:Sspe_Gene.15276::Locus_5309_Transcript_1_1_Confidence_1.000_Length_1337::g.15276::m.15276/K00639/kbl, GCAT; glycine C-acetyltransferase
MALRSFVLGHATQRRFAGQGPKILRDILQKQIEDIKEAGTFKNERVINTPQQSLVGTQETKQPVLNFCANNYLGLSNHPEIREAAKHAIDTRGFGMSSVRFICGTQDVHKELETRLSAFLGTEDTILYPSCFDANAGVFEAVLTNEDAVISDALNHASIIDGIRLCKAERHRYNHMDMDNLEEILKATQHRRLRLIVTDGVFSMDGDVAPLDKIVALADKYDAAIFVDDAHGTGVMGPGGRGTPAFFNVQSKIDILNSTLGKAMGGASGGFCSGSKEVVTIQRQKARPYLFSNTMAPCVAAGSLKALDILERDDSVVSKLRNNTKLFREGMQAAGFKVSGNPECAIVPVMVGDARKCATLADEMLKKGIYVIGFSYPVVPKGQARIRVQLSAAHTEEQVKNTVAAFKELMPRD